MLARCLLIVALLSASATAEEREPSVAASVASGAVTLLVPMIAGGITAATADADYTQRRIGLHTLTAGLMLAPLVSHFAAREWKRGLIFGGLSVGLGLLTIGITEGTQSYVDFGSIEGRVSSTITLAVTLLVSIVGVADSFGARDRYRARIRLGGSP